MAQEIFRLYGTIDIREDANISGVLDDINDSAGQSGDAINGFQDKLDELGSVSGGVGAILGTALIAALKESVDMVDEMDGALGDLEASTNATSGEMIGFEGSLEDLYRKGYGENFNDIADAMAEVHKQTGATNEELEKQVETTMTLSKVLGADYGETIRTVDNMVRIFGITHEEAFDTISKGYQENLNVGGDLLDLFNEYSVKFEQLGMDQEDMLAIMLEGQEQGIFNYDILLDGIKEYQIRVMELASDTEASKELFADLGLNVKDVNQAYTDGGQAAEDMSIKIWEALATIKDPLEQNRIGTELFGTMWEDTGGKINVAALGVKKDIDSVKGATDDLLKANSDQLAEKWEITFRKWKADTLIPMGQVLKDLGIDFLNFFAEANDATLNGFDSLNEKIDSWIASAKKKLREWKKSGVNIFEDFNAMDAIMRLIDKLVGHFENMRNDINSITSGLSRGWDSVSNSISGVINKISNIDFPSPPSWFPGFADGVRNFQGGWAVVGERGKELVHLPPGSDVYSNNESQQMLNQTTRFQETLPNQTSNVYNIENITIDPKNIKDMTDFIDIISNFNNNMISYGGV
jgi:phage-related minor tail protein